MQIKKLGNYLFTGKNIGKGHFGCVELALHTITNVEVAVKITELHQDDKISNLRRNFFREVSMLNKLNHPGIVKMHETLRTKNMCCLVMEYVDGGDLLNYIRDKDEGRLEENEGRFYFKQIVSVLEYLHKRRIVHRDLKMENILLQGPKKKVIKLIDFGLSNVFSKGEFLTTKCGSPEYAAPELFQKDHKYGTEVDVWSLGIILYGMLIGQLPFRDGNYGKLVLLISKGLTDYHEEKMNHLREECVHLLSNILQPDPKKRYSILNIMVHSWTSEGQGMHTVSRIPTIDPRIKHKIVSNVANLMEVSKTEVNVAVDLRNYDSVFAVYNILLQEELKRAKCPNKHVSSLDIKVHDRSVLVAKNGIYSGAIPHRFRYQRKARCEKAINEYTCIVGKRIDYTKRMAFETKLQSEGKDVHGDVKIRKRREDLKNKRYGERDKAMRHEDASVAIMTTEDVDSDHSSSNEASSDQIHCKECRRLSNVSKQDSLIDQPTVEVIKPRPSIDDAPQTSFQISSVINDTGHTGTREDIREVYGLKGSVRDKRNASGVAVTCVTLQDFELKERNSVQHTRKPVYPNRVPERKGSRLNTIPSKETVNPSRDLQEVIEERLKPCLKNSVASLRERPRTATTKVDERTSLPRRPMTVAICYSRDRASRVKGWATRGSRDTSLTGDEGNHSNTYIVNDKYVGSLRTKKVSKNISNIKVDVCSLDKKQEIIEVAGKKVQIETGSTSGSNPTQEKNRDERRVIMIPHQNYPHSHIQDTDKKNNLSDENCSSIDAIVGTGCLKKPEKADNSEKNVNGISNEESLGKIDEEAQAFVYDLVMARGESFANYEKTLLTTASHEKLDTKAVFILDESQARHSENLVSQHPKKGSDTFEKYKNNIADENQKEEEFRTSEACVRKYGVSTRMIRKPPIMVEKSESLDKLICTGDKIHADIACRKPPACNPKENVPAFSPTCSNHVFVPSTSSVAPSSLVAPSASVVRTMDAVLENKMDKKVNTKSCKTRKEMYKNEEIGGQYMLVKESNYDIQDSSNSTLPKNTIQDFTNKRSEKTQNKRKEITVSTHSYEGGWYGVTSEDKNKHKNN